MPRPANLDAVALREGWRSGLEEKVAASLESRGVDFQYEKLTLTYTLPEKPRKYTPDFIFTSKSGKEIIVETKGRWVTADRQKMLAVIQQNPDRDIRMVFSNPNQKIAKGSKTSYADWCQKWLAIPYASKDIPTAWLLE